MRQRTRLPYQLKRVLIALVLAPLLAGCGGPSLIAEDEVTPIPTATIVVVAPTAAVGATTGAPCESGTLKLQDLQQIESRWRDGLAGARARALVWQDDAVLIELRISCELFESGFRWQATFFSRNAQAYYTADTAEVVPVNLDPDTIIPLPERDVNFNELYAVIEQATGIIVSPDATISILDVRVSTESNPIGPPGVPTGAAIYHLSLRSRGEVLELYIDGVQGQIYQFE